MADPMGEPERTGFAGWWDRLGRGQRSALVVVGLIVGVNVGLSALGGLIGGTPGGPVSSSFSTGSDGLQGWSELLSRSGHHVDRRRGSVVATRLAPGETVVVADPVRMARSDARRLAVFLRSGGRLVLVGPTSSHVFAAVASAAGPTDTGAGPTSIWLPVADTG